MKIILRESVFEKKAIKQKIAKFFFFTSNHLFSRFVGQLKVDCSQLDMVGGSVETVWALFTHLEVS